MPWGTSYQDVYVAMTLTNAYEACQLAAVRTGNLELSFPAISTMIIRSRWLVSPVTLRVSVHPAPGGSTIKIVGTADIVWGWGAKQASDDFIAELNRALTDPQT